MPQPPPRPRQASQPKLQGAITGGDQPERAAVNHPGVDGVAQAPPRKPSVTGMRALQPPPLPAEHAQTVPAPRQDAPTLPAAPEARHAQVRIEDAPGSLPGGSLPPASQDPRDGRLAALERENERLRALHSLPPDRGAWAKLGYRIAAAAAGAVVLIIAALGARAVSIVEDKAATLTKSQKKSKAQLSTREELWNGWGDRVVEVIECRHRRQAELNKRQFPEVQRGEPGPWPIYKNDCGELPERPRAAPAPAPVDELPEP